MPSAVEDLLVTQHAPIPTWFGIGGGADRIARPENIEQLAQAIRLDPGLLVLGDGANLLVDDDGVRNLVVCLSAKAFSGAEWNDATGHVRCGAGANLPKIINESVRRGLGGLEGLGGIPASIGGAIRMNAGGTFGQIADAVARVHALNRSGDPITLDRSQISFSYRHSGLDDLIITEVELQLAPQDPQPLRAKLKDVMEYKKNSQPMAERSAGCVFKNPTLTTDLHTIGAKGQRVSAGMLIDKAGCKGMSVGGASVSQRHGNFIVTDPATAKARHVIDLMDLVTKRVFDTFGVTLQPEVVVWRSR